MLIVTHHSPDAQPPFKGQSPTIPEMVTHHPWDGHPPSLRWSPPFPEWSTTIQNKITHHSLDSLGCGSGEYKSFMWRGVTDKIVFPNHFPDCYYQAGIGHLREHQILISSLEFSSPCWLCETMSESLGYNIIFLIIMFLLNINQTTKSKAI